MKIGLLSDTHGFLDPTLNTHFSACDEIWHAGDIGDPAVTDGLRKITSLRAVHGNIDDPSMRKSFQEDLWFECEGVSVFLTHIAGKPPSYNPRVRKLVNAKHPRLLICGHSHILQVKKDEVNNLLFINPGAAGQHGFHSLRTAIRMEIESGAVRKLEVIELGKRGV
ncbi:MAG: metallophosphoesterase family protein [Bacteroidetes bacterium]|nr:metallophosphoesterase family protein [Bacteroidota bacterium]